VGGVAGFRLDNEKMFGLLAWSPNRLAAYRRIAAEGCSQAAMLLHAAAQRRQASAQSWHASLSCLAHSVAQASQIFAQSAHQSAAKGEPRDMARAQAWQISAQSRQSLRQSAIAASPMQQSMQVSQAAVQSRQAWMQSLVFWSVIRVSCG